MASSPSSEAPAAQHGSLNGDAGGRKEAHKLQRGVSLALPQSYLLKLTCHAVISFNCNRLLLRANPMSREPVEEMEAWTLGTFQELPHVPILQSLCTAGHWCVLRCLGCCCMPAMHWNTKLSAGSRKFIAVLCMAQNFHARIGAVS